MGQGNVGSGKLEPSVSKLRFKNISGATQYLGLGLNNRGISLEDQQELELTTWNHKILERVNKYVNDGILEVLDSPSDTLPVAELFNIADGTDTDTGGTNNAQPDPSSGTVTITLVGHTIKEGDWIRVNTGSGNTTIINNNTGMKVLSVDGDTFTVAPIIDPDLWVAPTSPFNLDWFKIFVVESKDHNKHIELTMNAWPSGPDEYNVVLLENLPAGFKLSVSNTGDTASIAGCFIAANLNSAGTAFQGLIGSGMNPSPFFWLTGGGTHKVVNIIKQNSLNEFTLYGDLL